MSKKSRFNLKLGIAFAIIITIIPAINGAPFNFKSIASNWTTEDVEKFKQNAITNLQQLAVFNCTMTFFPIKETIQSLKECSNELTSGHRRKRDAMTPVLSAVETFLGYHPEPIHFYTSTRNNRRVRDAPKIKGGQDESEDPCIGHCVLQKLGMFDAQGTPDKDVLTSKIANVLTHTKDAKVDDATVKAEAIVTGCLTQWRKQLEKLYDGGGNIEMSKCSAATKLGGCLSKDTMKACILRNSAAPAAASK